MTQEQWMQVIVIVGPIILTGTSMFVATTWFLASRIERGAESMRSIVKMVGELSPKVDDLIGRMSASEARLTNLERQIDWLTRSRD